MDLPYPKQPTSMAEFISNELNLSSVLFAHRDLMKETNKEFSWMSDKHLREAIYYITFELKMRDEFPHDGSCFTETTSELLDTLMVLTAAMCNRKF